ncbi:uncharacterized protein LOC132792885 [Drosophila nasuta]|uniref:uncharacterized protein LOC132792885 n=1 Tax=Drosophila nasuta TaxID=42062 RepID=UPI00295F4B47|nr:uncharacterized protein LOC132792885 [Drosophila nasuta]
MLHKQSSGASSIIAGILREVHRNSPLAARCETRIWLNPPAGLPIWSRRLSRNMEGVIRQLRTESKWYNYDVEISEHLWSLWGGLHPSANCFEAQSRGRQTLACCVVACCAASAFRDLKDWTPKLLDAIVLNGDKYYRESLKQRRFNGSYLKLSDLSLDCEFLDIRFMVHGQLDCFGQLYNSPSSRNMGLFESLNYFFTRFQLGILECQQHYLAFGYSANDGAYFLYDCAWDAPLFPSNMGASYVLRAKHLFLLLYCIIVTLNVRKLDVNFQLFSVDINRISGSRSRQDQLKDKQQHASMSLVFNEK